MLAAQSPGTAPSGGHPSEGATEQEWGVKPSGLSPFLIGAVDSYLTILIHDEPMEIQGPTDFPANNRALSLELIVII